VLSPLQYPQKHRRTMKGTSFVLAILTFVPVLAFSQSPDQNFTAKLPVAWLAPSSSRISGEWKTIYKPGLVVEHPTGTPATQSIATAPLVMTP